MINNAFSICVLGFMAASLSACMSEINTVRELSPDNDSYQGRLVSGYRDLALYEADEMYDWFDARTFARKAIAARDSIPIKPENPDDWYFSDHDRSQVEIAHSRLASAISEGFSTRAPTSAADAQVAFDCWIEQLEEGWQLDHIARCRDLFDAAMRENVDINVSSAPALIRKSNDLGEVFYTEEFPKQQLACGPGKDKPAEEVTFRLYFNHGDAAISEKDRLIVAEIAQTVAEKQIQELFVTGHTDRSGSSDLNIGLALDRATNVWQALLESGVNPTHMWIGAHGEMSAEIATADGVRDHRNRRVTIYISSSSNESFPEDCVELTSGSL